MHIRANKSGGPTARRSDPARKLLLLRRVWSSRWAAALVLVALLLLPLLLPAPRATLAIEIGAEPELNVYGESRSGFYLFDMHAPERDADGGSYRWTKDFSTLRLLNIFAQGTPLLLELRACGCRPASVAAVATLQVNQAPPLALPLAAQFRTYRLLVPQRPSDYGRDLYLAFLSRPFNLPGDDRALGLRLAAVRVVSPGRWAALGVPPLVAWLLYALSILGTSLLASRKEPGTRHQEAETHF